MSRLLIISERSGISFWGRFGKWLFKSHDYIAENPIVLMNFINRETPEIIYFELGQDIEADDINELLQQVNTFPLKVIVLEAKPFKLNLFSLFFPLNFLEKLFPPHKTITT